RGKIKHIDTRAAANAPGVISVLTHENAPAMKPTAVFGEESDQPGAASSSIPYLNIDEIYFYGQPIAVIVAETLEQAEHAATLVKKFSLAKDHVRVIGSFVGGGFGGKGNAWAHVSLAVAAAKVVKRPVKLMLSREGVHLTVGGRTPTEQRVALAANDDGKLT